jgi:hypothetical protein
LELQENRNVLSECRMCLCLRHLAAPLAEETTEETQPTLVRESGIGISGDDCLNPT